MALVEGEMSEQLNTVLRLARQAGFQFHSGFLNGETRSLPLCLSELEYFYHLVAAAEREKLNKKIAALEADVDHFFKLSGQYLERANKAEEAVALERERCAKVCERVAEDVTYQLCSQSAADKCADAIRG